MESKFVKGFLGLILLIFVLSFAGCASSDDDSTTTTPTTNPDTETELMPSAAAGSDSLTIASKVSVIEAKEDTGSESLYLNTRSISSEINRAIDTDGFAADADYNLDVTQVWVHEESVQAFNTVNEILCSIDQTRYGDMKGEGNYRAQIDTDQCSSGNDDPSSAAEESQNQSSASTRTEYENWTVNSSREENEPHIIKVWVNQEADDQDPASLIMAKMEIYRSSTDENPYGFFRMNFVGYPVDDDGDPITAQIMFKGYMRTVLTSTGQILLQFSNQMSFDGMTFSEQATFRRSAGGTSGAGSLSAPEWGGDGPPSVTTFNIAYNEDYFLRAKSGDEEKCFDRNEFDQTVWGYSMYDNAGARIDMNSGFPITYEDASSDKYHGWVGFHGLWMPGEASISNGDTVSKETYDDSGGTSEDYTVFISGGRLMKHTRKSILLGELKNIPLQWGDSSGDSWVQYRVEWDGTSLKKTAILDETNWNWQELSSTEDVSFDTDNDFSFHFWSEALGGSGSFALKDNTGSYQAPDASTDVIFHLQDVVYPTDTIPSTLLCFQNCPDPTQLTDPSADSLTLTDKNWWIDATPDSSYYYEYTFDSASMVLKYGGNSAVMSAENSSQPWGFHSGILFDATTDNFDIVACDWNSSQTCNWQAWDNMVVYYTWETGPEEWNKFTAIKDSNGDFARFDPPKMVTYVHSQTDSTKHDNKYDGVKFNLDYSGFGNLHGIPGRCVSPETGATAQCDQNARWIPEFNITAGSLATDVADGTTEYVIKPLHVEQQMSKVDASLCSDLSLTSYTLPGIDDWTDPSIGDQPTIDGAPAVIGGVLQ